MTSSIAKSGHAHARGRQSPGTMSGAYRNSQLRGRLRHGAHRRARAAGAARPLETAGRGEVIFASERAPGQEEPLGCSWRWRWGCESLDDGKTFGEMQGAANRRAGRAAPAKAPAALRADVAGGSPPLAREPPPTARAPTPAPPCPAVEVFRPTHCRELCRWRSRLEAPRRRDAVPKRRRPRVRS